MRPASGEEGRINAGFSGPDLALSPGMKVFLSLPRLPVTLPESAVSIHTTIAGAK
jgi:hypothetical protein